MRARGVRIGEIVSTLRSDNFSLAGGYVREGTKKFYVRSLAQYVTLREIENIQIQSRAGKVRLGDVASVVFEVPEKSWIQRIDGKRGMSFGIKQESGANIADVTDRVVAKLKAIEEESAHGRAGVRFRCCSIRDFLSRNRFAIFGKPGFGAGYLPRWCCCSFCVPCG